MFASYSEQIYYGNFEIRVEEYLLFCTPSFVSKTSIVSKNNLKCNNRIGLFVILIKTNLILLRTPFRNFRDLKTY